MTITTRNQWMIGAFWMGICLMATYFTMSYDFERGRLGPRAVRWPAAVDHTYSTALTQPPTKTTVLAFLHPRCVCTRATVKQLVRAFETHPGASLIVPVFTPLDGALQAAWEKSDYVRTIRSKIPTAEIIWDQGGLQARRFGAFTSGTILVYDAQGWEIFRGGITDRRGGEGDNPGIQ